MERPEVVQRLLKLYVKPAYLEVGVNHGLTFNHVNAAKKIAVDPKFNFDIDNARKLEINNGSTFHQVISDDYFSNILSPGESFDVIFLDGLHTFDQTLRDLLYAINCLNEGGVILIDDVMPTSYAASLPTMEEMIAFREACDISEHAWMGDVFRLVFFIKDYMPSYSYATIAENHGQTVVWKAPRPCPADCLSVEAISRLSFGDAMLNKSAFNLQPFEEILQLMGRA